MLINCVNEEDEGKAEEKEVLNIDVLEEYHTANELFEIMAKDHPYNFDVLDNKSLTTRDLVILYENVDLGTKLMSNANECNKRAPNQYVETIIYNDDLESEDSDAYEIYSHEDLHNMFSINNERIELYSNVSFENSLCHKFGNTHMKSSNFSNDYEKHFLFNDLYIKGQLQSFHAMTDSKCSDSAVLPPSLLDYICCKRLEDNYNFYMDNIICHVQNTIEQLKRISNGDYLTDRVKEKWREVENAFNNKTKENDKIIALSCTRNSGIPIEGKISKLKNTWNEIVHSEMDVRSLAKILQKKIIVQIPKVLCGSFGIFNKDLRDNITITYKKSKDQVTYKIKEESSSDVLKLQRPNLEHTNQNMNSVIVLKTSAPSITRKESCEDNCLTVELHVKNVEYDQKEKAKIVELDDNENEVSRENFIVSNTMDIDEGPKYKVSSFNDNQYERDSSVDLMPAEELGFAIRRLNMQSSVLEENEDSCAKKKKSPTRVRIKSPYENKSFILDERKRKRLLEIRERREKRKLAMNENCKISKHKYAKGAVMAQSSNSVTKLSITNKSFYNSIYGHTNKANKNFRNVIKGQKQDNVPNIAIQGSEEEFEKQPPVTSPDKNGQKYINRSYYLDDADTEVMYLQMKPNNNDYDVNEILTPSTSVLSSDVDNITGLKNLINPSTTDLSGTDTSSLHQNISLEDSPENTNMQNNCLSTIQNAEIVVPSNTPKLNNSSIKEESKKITTSVECRKSIDKIYDLMKKITVSPVTNEDKNNKNEKSCNFTEKNITDVDNKNTTLQGSDSGTSLKLQITSSNPSSFGLEKENSAIEAPRKLVSKKTETSTTVIPKVIISSKFQDEKKDISKIRKESKKADNPLKAISQLLHEIDNVQKTRHKIGKETRTHKKTDNIGIEIKSHREVLFKNTPREMKSTKHNEQRNSRFSKPLSPNNALKISQQTQKGDKTIHKKKLSDIIDEVKELRGEAVRGPSKRTSRIDDLAQPKKSYVQAHHEDFQNKYSKNFIPRVQKIPTTPLSMQEKSAKITYKTRQRGAELIGIAKQSNKIIPSLGKPVKSADSSPVKKEKHLPIRNIMPDNNDPHSLKNKMLAVVSYLKNHYGRVSPIYKEGDKNLHKSRVPLIPTDIDIASMTSSPIAEESTTIGIKLHNMINSKINTTTLTNTKLSPDNKECNIETDSKKAVESLEHLSKCGPILSSSDHPVDIFEDKNIITAVACISKEDSNDEGGRDKGNKANATRHELQEPKSCNELQTLENALYRQMSNGTFQKRLRIKNLTLTPKQSMQQVFVLQSGDTKSLIMKSTISQKLDISKTETIPKLNLLSLMPSAIKLKLPTQIATVGYVFPTYEAFKIPSNNKAKKIDNEDFVANMQIITSNNNECADKTVQCYKGNNEQQSLKQTIDSKDNHLFNKKTLRPKDTSEELKETITQQELTIASTQEKIIPQNIDYNVHESENVRTKTSENFSESTSLDILVGLLNEIKKITTCQSNLVTPLNETDTYLESKELKVILNNSAAQDNSVDHSVKNSISISSFDYQPRTRPSNFSLYLKSNIEDYVEKIKIAKENDYVPPSVIDKEVNVQITSKQLVHRVTEVPSRFFPVTVNRSTDVIKSLIALANKTSNESVSSYSDCRIVYSNSTIQDTNIVPYQRQSNASSKPGVKILQERFIKLKKTKNILNVPYAKVKSKNNNILKINVTNERNFNVLQEFDPLIKMKRDVLVTVYSILVLTVFAALTFPEIIYHT